jgi:hypothetical protein
MNKDIIDAEARRATMPLMKHEAKLKTSAFFQRIASIGLLVGMSAAFGPTGCSNSLQQASARYREQHQNRHQLLGDAAVEKLQACVDEFSDQLSVESLGVSGVVQMDREGRIYGVTVTGFPDGAQDLAACTRSALSAVAVPDLPLRATSTEESANTSVKPTGNEMANPAIALEVAILLGEFAAQHGGKVVLYSVTVEVLSAAAIAAVTVYLTKTRKKKSCTEHLQACLDTPMNDEVGNNWNTRRCKTCFDICRPSNQWPTSVPFFNDVGSCEYWNP